LTKKFFLAAVAAGALATPAAAQEAFDGFRIEALTGYDSLGVSVDEDVAGEELSGSKSGVAYGVAAGYDYAIGGVVIGAEVEVADSSVGEDLAIDEVIEGMAIDGTASLNAAEDIYLGGRVGVPVGASTLLYAKGGYSMAKVKLHAEGTVDGEAGEIGAKLSLDGLRLGAGVEHTFGSNVFGKLEYRYTNYSLGDLKVGGTEVELGDALDFIDSDRHQVVVGVGYRF
jgi:outer membrane immunogenic protein